MSVDDATTELVIPAQSLEALFADLTLHAVRSCHWKSNSHLAEAVRGETDLDLLVDEDQTEEFRKIVDDHGFKPMLAAPGKDYPGVENYLGFDPAIGRLIHLHVHYDLVLGQQHVKDHHLPIEGPVLDSVHELSGVPVPAAAVELVILAMRAVLKYRARDAVKDMLSVRSPGIPQAILDEAVWLRAQTTDAEIRQRLAELQPAVPDDLILEIIDLLTSGSTGGSRLFVLRNKMRAALEPYRRISRGRATQRYMRALWRKRVQSRTGKKRRMRPAQGGMTVALIGSDGAGKSAVVSEVQQLLSKRMDVSTIYMGAPDLSPTDRLVKRLSKLALAAGGYLSRKPAPLRSLAQPALGVGRYLLARRRVAEARGRHRSFLQGQEAAAQGRVVIYDRYPLENVRIHDRAMDGARLETEIPQPRGRRVERLLARERELHRKISAPDHVIALDVSPDVSLGRKPDHDPTSIGAKTTAIREALAANPEMVRVDADAPFEEVVPNVNLQIWSWL